jgi:hypothetical protein
MTAVEILHAQHREVLALFKRLENGSGDRAKWLEELRGKLRLHTRLEETLFYPTLETYGSKRIKDEVLESYEEHRLVDFLLAQLTPTDVDSEPSHARVRVLQSLIEEHVEEEETEVFKHVDNLSEEQVRALDVRMREELEEVQRVDELLGRAAVVARRTEQWAGSLLDASMGLPRRAVSAIAPSRWLPSSPRYLLAARIAGAVPRVVVDSLYQAVTGRGGAHGRRAA